MAEKLIDIIDIRTEAGTDTRAELDETVIAEYEENYKNNVEMPAVRVFVEKAGDGYILTRGFHRVAAAKRAGRTKIAAEIFKGSLEDAKDDALGSNHDHGHRRTQDDKRHEIMLALAMPRYAAATDRQIAEKCHVSHTFVGKIRKEMGGDTPAEGEATTPGAEGAKGGDGASEAGATTTKPRMRVGKDGRKFKATKPARKPAGNRFCDRCTRVGPVKDCAKCKELNGGKAPTGKPAAATKPAETKNGEPAFSIQTFKSHVGAASRECYKLARQYRELLGDKEPPELLRIRAQCAKMMTDVESWRAKLNERAKKAKEKAKAS